MPVDPITLYVTHFSSLANGHALWNPDQGYADASGRLPHIRPGDVGFVDRSGSFIRLFNLHLGKDDVDQGIAVPKDFGDPLPKGPKGSHVWSYEAPTIQHVYKRSAWGGSLKADMPVSPANVNASMSFNFDHKTDAILGFFDTGVREKSIMNAKYFEEVVNNCENWLNAATETVDPNLSLRDLRLVTECTRVRSWVRGIVEDARKDGQLSLSVDFGPLSSGGQLSKSVEYKGGSHISHGPADRITKSQPVIDSGTSTQPLAKHSSKIKNKKSPNKDKFVKPPPSQPKSSAATLSEKDRENIKGWSDQCIFIRSLRFEHRLGIMGKNLPLKIRAQAKPNDLRKGGDPHEDAEDKYYVFSEDGDGESEDEKSWDHMVVVLEYIFENSDAEFALVHEEDLLPYARLVPLKKRVEPLTAALILEECHPKITTSDYNGIKVGTVSRPPTSPELGIHKGIASGISKINEDIPRYAVQDNSEYVVDGSFKIPSTAVKNHRKKPALDVRPKSGM
ncbi:hypothetical protein D9757_012735 [Collybiopsis confluens]|uniref:Uncharacterized protein n=1 Tax=Collybiopsis confluens TaxID=2823264 RepID=A0A8H5D5D7_9AGAR|nr:hypothetical protein D9757_012735 [Collybiopsis confluens]